MDTAPSNDVTDEDMPWCLQTLKAAIENKETTAARKLSEVPIPSRKFIHTINTPT